MQNKNEHVLKLKNQWTLIKIGIFLSIYAQSINQLINQSISPRSRPMSSSYTLILTHVKHIVFVI